MVALLPSTSSRSDTLRGILLMLGSMALFAVEDAFIKLATGGMPAGQVLAVIGTAGSLVFAAWAKAAGQPILGPWARHPRLWLRNLCEVVGTLGFVTALTLIPLSTASAILQATPIMVTAGAALFLRESVGWRRWSAVLVGFLGVLLILRPGADAFDPQALWAVLGVLGLASRDLVTRRMPPGLPTLAVATWGFVSVTGLGLVMLALSGGAKVPSVAGSAYLAGALTVGVVAYWAIIEATRRGDVSAIQPFRYSRLVFAMLIGMLVFAERPDGLTLCGSGLIVASGLYAFARERARKRASLVA